MVAGCGNKCVKYFFWLINFLFFILGIVVLAFSVWLRVDPSMLGRFASSIHINMGTGSMMDSIYFILYGLMVIGALLLILGFLGCCGSWCESLCIIGLYFVFVILLFVVKVVGIVLYFVNKDKIRDYMLQIMRSEIVANYSKVPLYRDMMDSIQYGLQCCGAYACNDYSFYTQLIPNSCPNCAQFTVPGCGLKLWAAIESNLLIVIVIIFAILIVELFALILDCIMCGAVKDKRNQTY